MPLPAFESCELSQQSEGGCAAFMAVSVCQLFIMAVFWDGLTLPNGAAAPLRAEGR